MGNFGTSYTYHKEIESPGAFIRREWKSFAVFGGGFVALLVVAIVLVSPAFYYPRLGTDPLRYYLTARAFAHTGHTTLQTAVNGTPFNLVAMPGILRAPFMLAFSDFDAQLRAIQLSNLLLVAATATLYSYVLSWAVPHRWHWLAVGFSFGFLLLSVVAVQSKRAGSSRGESRCGNVADAAQGIVFAFSDFQAVVEGAQDGTGFCECPHALRRNGRCAEPSSTLTGC